MSLVKKYLLAVVAVVAVLCSDASLLRAEADGDSIPKPELFMPTVIEDKVIKKVVVPDMDNIQQQFLELTVISAEDADPPGIQISAQRVTVAPLVEGELVERLTKRSVWDHKSYAAVPFWTVVEVLNPLGWVIVPLMSGGALPTDFYGCLETNLTYGHSMRFVRKTSAAKVIEQSRTYSDLAANSSVVLTASNGALLTYDLNDEGKLKLSLTQLENDFSSVGVTLNQSNKFITVSGGNMSAKDRYKISLPLMTISKISESAL